MPIEQDDYAPCPATRHKAEHFQHTCFDCAPGPCRRLRALGLDNDANPLPKRDRPTCGAKTRTGQACQMKVVPGKKRCRLHGGLSTGPKTKAGRARIAEAQRLRWKKTSTGA